MSSGRGVTLTVLLPLVPRLRMGGVLTPLHLPASRRGQKQIYPLYKLIPGRGSNPGIGKNVLQNHPDRHWDPKSLLFNTYRGFIPGIKAAGA